MTSSDPRSVLGTLRARIATLERGSGTAPAPVAYLPFGLSAIDRLLPGRGLQLGALHEVAPAQAAISHAAACTLFAAGILARTQGPILWCLAARDLFAPALARVGLHPDRVIYVETYREAELLPLVEEGARFRGLAGVVGEVARTGLTASRRLQLCAEESGVTVLLVRRAPAAAEGGGTTASAATSRWSVEAVPASRRAAGFGRGRWRVGLQRCRGAALGSEPASWLVEACDEAGRLALPADLAERSHPQARQGRAAAG